MTVLYCLSHINKSLQWLWYAEELQKRGIRQVYLLFDINEGYFYLYDDLKKLGIDVYLIPHKGKFWFILNILRTVRFIRKYKVDIVHTSLPLANVIGQSASWLMGMKKRVTTCENASWAHDFKSKKQEWIDRFTFRLAKNVIATSEIAADYLNRNWRFDKRKLSVIYHGLKQSDYEVSDERITKVLQQSGINKKNHFIVGIISRFEYWKGHEFIIEAAGKLRDYPEIKFYIFGSNGSYYNEAMRMIKDMKLEEKVFYGGFVEDSSALYKLFSLQLHVPVNEHVETGGITIIEGMMAERPQVLTLSGYAWQVSKHMHNAYIVPFQNGSAIADAILWMKNNPDDAKRMARQAKKDAYVFSVQTKTDRYLEVYNELLK